MMKITGSIVTHNNSRTIYDCISGILKNTKDRDYDFRLYVYDNNSEDDTVSIIVKNFPEVTVICDEDNRGFGYGHNAIMKKVHSDVHMVINPDVVVDMDTIGILAKYISEHDEVGLVTPRVLNRDGSEQYLPKYCPTIRYTGMSKLPGFHYLRRRYTRQNEKFEKPTEIEFCTGCFFAVRTDYIKKMRGFSNRYFMYCEDSDLSRRVMKDNKKIIFYPDAYIYHDWKRDNTNNFVGMKRFIKSLLVYFHKWGWEF